MGERRAHDDLHREQVPHPVRLRGGDRDRGPAGRSPVAGFTLVELLLVVVIIGILAALVVPRIIGRANEARIQRARLDITTLRARVQEFEMHVGRLPTQEESLLALVVAPAGLPEGKWKGPYIDQTTVPTDPWGRPYVYRVVPEQNQFEILSAGPDGSEETDDDVHRP